MRGFVWFLSVGVGLLALLIVFPALLPVLSGLLAEVGYEPSAASAMAFELFGIVTSVLIIAPFLSWMNELARAEAWRKSRTGLFESLHSGVKDVHSAFEEISRDWTKLGSTPVSEQDKLARKLRRQLTKLSGSVQALERRLQISAAHMTPAEVSEFSGTFDSAVTDAGEWADEILEDVRASGRTADAASPLYDRLLAAKGKLNTINQLYLDNRLADKFSRLHSQLFAWGGGITPKKAQSDR
jgi:hypothetical protein